MNKVLNMLNWPIVIIACLTIGLAPFKPQPHVWEKLHMLKNGALVQPADIFDLAMHGLPWVILLLKLGVKSLARKA